MYSIHVLSNSFDNQCINLSIVNRIRSIHIISDHITSVFASHYWLPASFNILLIKFKALHELAVSYTADMLLAYEPVCSLRSSGRVLLIDPKSWFKIKGDQASAVKAPKLWNLQTQ